MGIEVMWCSSAACETIVYVCVAIFFAIFWAGIRYCLGRCSTKPWGLDHPKSAGYQTSFLHAVVSTILGLISATDTLMKQSSGEELCYAHTVWRDAFLLFSCGNLMQDLFVELAEERKDYGMIFHHIFVPVFLFIAVQRHLLTHALALLLLNEASTPFLCIRWFLKEVERSRGWQEAERRLYFRNGVCLLAIFFVFRVLLIPAAWLQAFLLGCLNPAIGHNEFDTVLVVIGNINFPVLWLLNLYWFVLLVKGALKALSEP